MTAMDDLRASDCVRFSGIGYHLSSALGESDRTSMSLCKDKTIGALALTLTSEDFNIPIPGLTFPFTGVVDGNRVRWTIDRDLDVWYSIAHITHVRGQIVTRVDEVAPMLTTNCSGAERIVKAALTTVGAENTLTIDTSVGSATASNITITGATCCQALEELFFNVRMRSDRSHDDGCGHHFHLIGDRVRLIASAENYHGDGTITEVRYSWSAPAGVTVHGGTDGRELDVTFDQHGPTVVACRAVITNSLGQTATQVGSGRFAVITPDEAGQLRLMCQLDRLAHSSERVIAIRGSRGGFTIGGFRVVDPLWDPVPDEIMLARGLSRFEAHEVRAAAEQLAHVASALVKQSTLVLEHHERIAKVETERAMKAGKLGKLDQLDKLDKG